MSKFGLLFVVLLAGSTLSLVGSWRSLIRFLLGIPKRESVPELL